MKKLREPGNKLRHVCKVLASCKNADQRLTALHWAFRLYKKKTISAKELDCVHLVARAMRIKRQTMEIK